MPAERSRHFGVLSFTGTGHVNPLIVLSQALKARGHKVTFFEKPKIADRVRQAGLEFVPLSDDKVSSKKARPAKGASGIWSEISDLRFNLKRVSNDIEMFLRSAPPVLGRSGVDALIVNEVALTGPTVAEILQLPYFIISTSVPHSFGWSPPVWLSSRENSGSWCGQLQRAMLELSVHRIRGPIRGVIDCYRRYEGLAPVRHMQTLYPCLAHITQIPECLDLAQTSLPANFHYTGPFVSKAGRPSVEFLWNRIDGRPLIYASLGSTRNAQAFVYRMIAEACRDLKAQLVISLGGRFDPERFADLPGDPLVVRYAPQLEILERAAIVITHAGPNTVLEALMQGIPMVAIPIALDQPAIAARLARLTLAEVISLGSISPEKIRRALERLFMEPQYRDSAQRIGATLRRLNGVERAADIIEAELAEHAGAFHRNATLTPLLT